jgi:hypothetical protein
MINSVIKEDIYQTELRGFTRSARPPVACIGNGRSSFKRKTSAPHRRLADTTQVHSTCKSSWPQHCRAEHFETVSCCAAYGKCWHGVMWTGLIWLRTGIGGELFGIRY